MSAETKVSRTSREWYEQRQKAIERDDSACQECGEEVGPKTTPGSKTAHVHHLIPVGEGGTHDLDNLVTLCAECHREIPRPQGEPNERNIDKSRAMLTDLEREQIAREHGDERRYQAASRIRRRINEELTQDVETLAEYHPELLAELREVVCGEDS